MGAVHTLQNIPPRTIIMSDFEIAQLPVFAQEIIHHQRKLEDLCSQPVVKFREAQNAFDRRAFLARSAERLWTSADDHL